MALSNQGKRDLKKELDKRHSDEAIQKEWGAIEDRNDSFRNIIRLQQKEQEAADQQNAREREVHRERDLVPDESIAREPDERKETRALRERASHGHDELRAHMAGNEENRHHEKLRIEEFLKEKKLIDEMVERIHREDEQALHEKWLRKQKTNNEITAFREAQEVWKELQRKQIERENKKIQEYMFSKQSDVQLGSHEKERKKQERDEMVECMRKYEERTKQAETEDLQQEMIEQGRNKSANLRDLKEVEKRLRQRIDIIRGLDSEEKEQEERQEQQAIDEACYKDKMRKNAEEETKLDTMSYEKGRIRKIQLRRDLEDLETGRERKHAQNMQVLLKFNDPELKQLAERKRKIEAERVRALKEHAKHLIGYMPEEILFDEYIPSLGDGVYQKPKR